MHRSWFAFCDTEVSGESKWQPNSRLAKFRNQAYEKVIRGTMLAFAPEGAEEDRPHVQHNQQYYVWDAMRHGNDTELMKPFKKQASSKMEFNHRCSDALFVSGSSVFGVPDLSFPVSGRKC